MIRTLCVALFAVTASGAGLTVQVSNETAPAGGTAQFKITLAAPALVSNASITMNFDPAIFGPIANAVAFSATGDQIGYANVNGQTLTASFSSSSASLGQLPGLPIFIVTVPVLASAKSGTSPISLDASQAQWKDQQGGVYIINVVPGTFTVGGTLSIQSVTPGGGFLPAGTIVKIAGTGFDATTIATIDGVLTTVKLISAQEIDLTIGGAVELTGKHLHVSTADFFCALPSAPSNASAIVYPLLPLTTYANVTWDRPDDSDYLEVIFLQNQNLSPVTVTFFFPNGSDIVTVAPPITIPPGEIYMVPTTIGANLLCMTSSAPMRMLEYRENYEFVAPPQYFVFPPTILSTLPSFFQTLASLNNGLWKWQIGTAPPPPSAVSITGSFPFTAMVSNAPWLSVASAQGTPPATLTLTPNVSNLSTGIYSGSVIIHTILPAGLVALAQPDIVLPVSIQVSALPPIQVSGINSFSATVGFVTPIIGSISVSTSGSQEQYSASFSTTSGGNWLSIAPTSGVTNGAIQVTADPTGLAIGTYTGNLIVQGPANTVRFPIQLMINPAISNGRAPLALNPASFTFALAAGTALYQYQFAGSATFILASASAQTQSGGNWLAVLCCDRGLYFDMNAASLAPGTYQGMVTLTASQGGSLQVPISLIVLTPSAPLTVTPPSASLTVQAGQSTSQSFAVVSSPSTLFTSTGAVVSASYTPATITAGFRPTQPGTIYTSVSFTSGAGTVTVPIVLNVTPSAEFPPILASVVSAASGTASAISPGEIISLFGTGLGSQVLINNVAAPLIYVSSSQMNAIVPYDVSRTATIQVTNESFQTATWTLPVAPSAPSIFTTSGSGLGQGAIVNQDGSLNSATNPAPRGSAVQIYATGGGQTTPLSTTGGVAKGPASLVLPYSVIIGGVNAQVLYAGAAPGEVNGVVQINVLIPATVAPGSLPVLVTIGGVTSQTGVTVAVQ